MEKYNPRVILTNRGKFFIGTSVDSVSRISPAISLREFAGLPFVPTDKTKYRQPTDVPSENFVISTLKNGNEIWIANYCSPGSYYIYYNIIIKLIDKQRGTTNYGFELYWSSSSPSQSHEVILYENFRPSDNHRYLVLHSTHQDTELPYPDETPEIYGSSISGMDYSEFLNFIKGSEEKDFPDLDKKNKIFAVDLNGELIVSPHPIVSEFKKEFYNPVLKQLSIIKTWDYNYQTRTYNIILRDGSKQIVQYLDNKILITDENGQYEAYYATEDSEIPSGFEFIVNMTGEKGSDGIQGLAGKDGESFNIYNKYPTTIEMSNDKTNIPKGKYTLTNDGKLFTRVQDGNVSYKKSTFFDELKKSPAALKDLVGEISLEGCASGADGKHHGKLITGQVNENGQYEALCNDCGEHFFLTKGQVQEAIKNNQQPGVNSLGYRRFPLKFRSFWDTSDGGFVMHYVATGSGGTSSCSPSVEDWNAPFTGTFYYEVDIQGVGAVGNITYPGVSHALKLSSGQLCRSTTLCDLFYSSDGFIDCSLRAYAVGVPPEGYSPAPGRPGNLPGGQFVIDEQNKLALSPYPVVNETTNKLYNPVLKQEYDIKSWTYDYQTRIYNLTLSDESKQTVQYLDDKILIINGENRYEAYYATEDSEIPSGFEFVVCMTGEKGSDGAQGLKGADGESFEFYKTYNSAQEISQDKENVPDKKYVLISSESKSSDRGKVYQRTLVQKPPKKKKANIYETSDFSYGQWKKGNPNKPDSEYPGFILGGSFDSSGNHINGGGRPEYDKWVSDRDCVGVGRGGVKVYRIPTAKDVSISGKNIARTPFSFSVSGKSGWVNLPFYFVPPFTGHYNIVERVSGVWDNSLYSGCQDNLDLERDQRIDFEYRLYPEDKSKLFDCTVELFAHFVPVGGNVEPSNDRPIALPGDCIVLPDGTPAGQIVNEDNDTITNPITGNVYTGDWSYDYSTRTYTMATAEPVQTIKVEYTDDSIIITEGDQTYTLNYVVPLDPTIIEGYDYIVNMAGESAYESALKGGYIGTEQQFYQDLAGMRKFSAWLAAHPEANT